MTRAPSTTLVRGHLPVLDGLRGIAVLAVMLVHFTQAQGLALSAGPVIDRLFWLVAKAGWIGVDLFFVLSGFLITGILVDTKEQPRYFQNFYVRRTLRILPLYYAFLILRLVIGPLVIPAWSDDTPAQSRWLWVHLGNVPIAVEQNFDVAGSYLSHFWSLAVEEQFYLLWPAVVLFCSRRRLTLVCLLMIPVAASIRALFGLAFDNTDALYVLLPARMDALAIGALVAVWIRGGIRAEAARRAGARVLIATGIAIVALFVWRRGLDGEDVYTYLVGFPLLATFFGSVIVCAISSADTRLMARLLARGELRFFGRYSYALYVFHLPLVPLVNELLFSGVDVPVVFGSRVPGQLLYLAVGVAMSTAAALVSWHVLEKHFLRLKDRLSDGRVTTTWLAAAGPQIYRASPAPPTPPQR